MNTVSDLRSQTDRLASLVKQLEIQTFGFDILAFQHAPTHVQALRVNNAALAGDRLPDRIKLLEWGANATTKGEVKVNAHTAANLPRNQRDKGFETVAIDFDHNSLPGSATYEKGRAIEIAGYGTPRVIPDDGLWLDEIQWTPAGEKFARNYKDLSPAPGLNDQGEVVFLHSAALTPNGSVYDLEFFSAGGAGRAPRAASAGSATTWALGILASQVPAAHVQGFSARLGRWQDFVSGPELDAADRSCIGVEGVALRLGLSEQNPQVRDSIRTILACAPARVVRQLAGIRTPRHVQLREASKCLWTRIHGLAAGSDAARVEMSREGRRAFFKELAYQLGIDPNSSMVIETVIGKLRQAFPEPTAPPDPPPTDLRKFIEQQVGSDVESWLYQDFDYFLKK